MLNEKKLILASQFVNIVVSIIIALLFFIIPVFLSLEYISDQAIYSRQIPKIALRTHKLISEKYRLWLQERIDSRKATQLSFLDISGTEWPLFGTVFYLWATEAIENDLRDRRIPTIDLPSTYAQGTLQTAARFLADPAQAKWVIDHWGRNYLKQGNLFYRMLLIAGLTSYQNVSHNKMYEPVLREQVNSLANELDKSPYGLVDDYPGQCYPIDIIAAIAVIKRADKILGLDHSEFVKHALRAYQDERLDPETLLPAYNVDSLTGKALGRTRGIGLSFMLIWSPELWNRTSEEWYALYKDYFWQSRFGLKGVREFSKYVTDNDWWFDVDSGPVISGWGVAATAFGIGAARAGGHFDDAYALSSEVIPLSWPLWDGTLLGARLLSNVTDAPYLGEMTLLFLLTRQPVILNSDPVILETPFIVYIVLCLFIFSGVILIVFSFRKYRTLLKESVTVKLIFFQIFVWCLFLWAGVYFLLISRYFMGIIFLCLGIFLPYCKKIVKQETLGLAQRHEK